MYKQIYNLEIIEELMQDGNSMEGDKRVAFVDSQIKISKATQKDGSNTEDGTAEPS